MNNYKKLILCFLIACAVFLLGTNKVYGLYFAGEASAQGYTSCTGNCGGHGFAACNWEEKQQTSDAGLLISVIEYDAGKNKETVLTSKVLKTSPGMWGNHTTKVTKQCTESKKRKDYYGSSECGNE